MVDTKPSTSTQSHAEFSRLEASETAADPGEGGSTAPGNDQERGEEKEEFGEIIKYTAGGFAGGLLVAFGLDAAGFQRSGLGQALVRTLSGEGESIFEGFFAIKRKLQGATQSLAQMYGMGKFVGMIIPWIVDGVSRLAGVDVYGVEGFYIPYFYALSDQMTASVFGFVHFRKREGAWGAAIARYARHPVMMTSLAVVLVVPFGLLGARMMGFSPTTQVFTALETIAANLCLLPPLVGWIRERRQRKQRAKLEEDS